LELELSSCSALLPPTLAGGLCPPRPVAPSYHVSSAPAERYAKAAPSPVSPPPTAVTYTPCKPTSPTLLRHRKTPRARSLRPPPEAPAHRQLAREGNPRPSLQRLAEEIARSKSPPRASTRQISPSPPIPGTPVVQRKDESPKPSRKNQVIASAAETGSGKTPSSPRFARIGRGVDGMIGHTQPGAASPPAASPPASPTAQFPPRPRRGYKVASATALPRHYISS